MNENSGSNINLSKHYKQINKLMQQNVQSQKIIQTNNYSQQRNSIPSKIQTSQKVKNSHPQPLQTHPNDVQIDGKHYLANQDALEKLKQIDEQIRAEKQLISKLKIQNQLKQQDNQNVLDKSYLSLDQHQLNHSLNQTQSHNRDQLMQTQTQADFSILQNRRNQATKQLETEEEKYKENIRKIQLKRSQIKKKIKQDMQIPIKIMDFKELQLKKQRKNSNNLEVQPQKSFSKQEQSHRIITQQKSVEIRVTASIIDSNLKQQEKSENQNKNQENSDDLMEKQQKNDNSYMAESQMIKKTQQFVQSNSKLQEQHNPINNDNSQSKYIVSVKQKKSVSKNDQFFNDDSKIPEKNQSQKPASILKSKELIQSPIQTKSRVSEQNSHKKYSVKMSSVIVPQQNESIKQIMQRKQHKSSVKSSSVKKSQNDMISNKQSLKSGKVNSIKLQARQNVSRIQLDSQVGLNSEQIQKSMNGKSINEKSVNQKSVIGKSVNENSVSQKLASQKLASKKLVNDKSVSEKSVSEKSETKNNDNDKQSWKQKSFQKSKSSSKKSQKNQLMYIPNVSHKQPSHKSFKKTDKSIQWSEIDISMYGKSHDTSNLNSKVSLMQQINPLQNILTQKQQKCPENQIQSNKINMKKHKGNDKDFFQEISSKEKKSQKSISLAPIQPNLKQKSQISEQRASNSNKSVQNRAFFVKQREGSVKEKVQRYDQFHRQHSLNNKKLQSQKLQAGKLDSQHQSEQKSSISLSKRQEPRKKTASYRSRKSNPISNGSVSKSKGKRVIKNESHELNSEQKFGQMGKQSGSDISISRVLISKEQINLLHSQIKHLQEKLIRIEQKQEQLAKQKNQERAKLEQIAVQSQNISTDKALEENIRDIQIEENNEEVIDQKSNQEIQEKSIKLQPLKNQDIELKSQKIQQIAQETQSQKIEEKGQTSKVQILNVQAYKIQNPSLKLNIQQQIINLTQIQTKFAQEKQQLLDQVSKLRKVIRDLQIQKIKTIDYQKNQSKQETKEKIPETENNEFGIIVHQNTKNQTINVSDKAQNNSMIHENRQKSPFGKIFKNPFENNASRLTQNLNDKQNSPDKRFRINIPKKISLNSQIIENKTFESAQLPPKGKLYFMSDEDGNEQLQRKRKQGYPITTKEGYVVVSQIQSPHRQSASNETTPRQTKGKNEDPKVQKSQITKDEVLQKFHRTNRQFHNFIQSSRIVNQTNSSMSSHNNLHFNSTDKSHQTNSFVDKRSPRRNDQQDDNPQNTHILNKLSSSDLSLQKDNEQQFKQSFTRIVDQIQLEQEDQQEEEITEIQIRDVQIPNLPQTPDIKLDQDQLMQLAIETFKVFNIEIGNEDTDFNMKKYKNCVIFTKASDTILWHYNGKFYLGGWKSKQNGEGEKTSYGIEIIPQKHIYKGQFMNGKKNGNGIMKSHNGTIYDGQWIDGVKTGQGAFYDSTTKVSYQGEWKEGKKNGYGILKFSQKQYYQGTFVKSVKDGYGTQVFINGDKYKGQYRKGKFHGKGKYSWANGSVFEGDFCEGMRHGNGVWKSAKHNGDIYVGTYLNDKKSGYGRYVWSNGCIYEGNFSEDVKHGKGRLIYTDGKQIKGTWQQGSLLQAVTENPKERHQQQVLKKSRRFPLSGHKVE